MGLPSSFSCHYLRLPCSFHLPQPSSSWHLRLPSSFFPPRPFSWLQAHDQLSLDLPWPFFPSPAWPSLQPHRPPWPSWPQPLQPSSSRLRPSAFWLPLPFYRSLLALPWPWHLVRPSWRRPPSSCGPHPPSSPSLGACAHLLPSSSPQRPFASWPSPHRHWRPSS